LIIQSIIKCQKYGVIQVEPDPSIDKTDLTYFSGEGNQIDGRILDNLVATHKVFK
jgi:hypothetical protein